MVCRHVWGKGGERGVLAKGQLPWRPANHVSTRHSHLIARYKITSPGYLPASIPALQDPFGHGNRRTRDNFSSHGQVLPNFLSSTASWLSPADSNHRG